MTGGAVLTCRHAKTQKRADGRSPRIGHLRRGVHAQRADDSGRDYVPAVRVGGGEHGFGWGGSNCIDVQCDLVYYGAECVVEYQHGGLSQQGAASLSSAELIAILLRTGSRGRSLEQHVGSSA